MRGSGQDATINGTTNRASTVTAGGNLKVTAGEQLLLFDLEILVYEKHQFNHLGRGKKIAENAVLNDIKELSIEKPIKLIEDNYMESEDCWIFFRKKDIKIPNDRWFIFSYNAYAISKKWAFSQIMDFNGEEKKLSEYLVEISKYFRQKNI